MINPEICVVFSERGHESLIVNNFRFVKKSTLSCGTVKWFCERRADCQAKCYNTQGEPLVLKEHDFQHNHEPDLKKYTRQAISNSCKRKAQEDLYCKPSNIMKTEIPYISNKETLSEDDVTRIRKNIYRSRKKCLPPLPKSVEETQEQLDKMGLITAQDERYLIENDDYGNTLVIFGCKTNVEELKTAPSILNEGNEGPKIVPKKRNIPSTRSNSKKKGKNENHIPSVACMSLSAPIVLASDFEPSTSGRSNCEDVIQEEIVVKDELINENYENSMELHSLTSTRGVEDIEGAGSIQHISSAEPAATFETVICGPDVQIKKEVFEDESGVPYSSVEFDPTLSWAAEEDESSFENVAYVSASTNIDLPSKSSESPCGISPNTKVKRTKHSSSTEKDQYFRPTATAAYLHAMRNQRPSYKIRNFVESPEPATLRGTNHYDPSLLWTGLGRRRR